MSGIAPKVKEDLARLYEYPEFKALEKWNESKRSGFAEAILKVNMQDSGSAKRIAFLQGQAYAHELMLLELRKIHKEQTKES